MDKQHHVMKQLVFLLLVGLFSPYTSILAQNNLKVEFSDLNTVPDFLNICGEPDDEVVLVSVDGLQPAPRQNIQATANLFEGVQFVAFDQAASTPGVTLISSDPNSPVFGLPDLISLPPN